MSKANQLLPMDYAVLRLLASCDGWMPTAAIPAKLFAGEIPAGAPDLIDLGVIEHGGELTRITPAGYAALNAA